MNERQWISSVEAASEYDDHDCDRRQDLSGRTGERNNNLTLGIVAPVVSRATKRSFWHGQPPEMIQNDMRFNTKITKRQCVSHFMNYD